MKSEILKVEKLAMDGVSIVCYKGTIRFSHRSNSTVVSFSYPSEHTFISFDRAFGNRLSISRFDFGFPDTTTQLCAELNLYDHEEPEMARDFCDFIANFPALMKMMEVHDQ